MRRSYVCNGAYDDCPGTSHHWMMCPKLPDAHKDSSIIRAYKMGTLQHLHKGLRWRLDDELRLVMHSYIEGLQGVGGGGGAPGAGDGGGAAGATPLQWTSDACDAKDGGSAFCILCARVDDEQPGPVEAPAAATMVARRRPRRQCWSAWRRPRPRRC
jgi:hypothetical protein